MPRKKPKPQSSYPINFGAVEAAMAGLKSAVPTHFDLRRVSPKLVDLVAPAILDGFADEQIINALTSNAAGSPDAMMALVAAVRQALEITQIGEGGDACKVANTTLPSHQTTAVGAAQVVGGTTKRRSPPKTPSPTAALQPPEAPAAEANSEPSISDMTNLAAEAPLDVADGVIVVAAAPPMETAPSMSPSPPTADGGGKGPVDCAVVTSKSTSETQTTPAGLTTSAPATVQNPEAPWDQAKPASPPTPMTKPATDPALSATDRIDAAAAPPPKAAPSATPSPPTGDRYKAAASDAAAPKSAPKPGQDQTRLEFPPTDRLAPQSEKF